VSLGEDAAIELPVSELNLTGTVTDPDSQTLTYTWTSEPASGVTFESAAAKDTKVQFTTVGTYTLKLVANDGSATGEDSLQVTVNPAVYPAVDTDADESYGWTIVAPADVGMDAAKLAEAQAYAETGGGAGLISRRGRLVHKWGLIDARGDLKSTTKSIGGIALGLAIDDGKVTLTDLAQTHLPTIGTNPPPPVEGATWPAQITISQLATHTAGFEKSRGYGNMLYQPGTTWSYSDGALNWLADLLTTVYQQDLGDLLKTRVWSVIGIDGGVNGIGDDLQWRNNASHDPLIGTVATRELAGGISANVNTMARIGLLFLRKGVWANDQRVLSESFVETVHTPRPENADLEIPLALQPQFPNATKDYGVLWWTNATGQLPEVPRDAYWAWGLGDSLIVVIPSLDLVIARTGSDADNAALPHWRSGWDGNYSVLAPFLNPIVQSVQQQ
jgi:CubicO group peptidase (beta-lactamase class C family)